MVADRLSGDLSCPVSPLGTMPASVYLDILGNGTWSAFFLLSRGFVSGTRSVPTAGFRSCPLLSTARACLLPLPALHIHPEPQGSGVGGWEVGVRQVMDDAGRALVCWRGKADSGGLSL